MPTQPRRGTGVLPAFRHRGRPTRTHHRRTSCSPGRYNSTNRLIGPLFGWRGLSGDFRGESLTGSSGEHTVELNSWEGVTNASRLLLQVPDQEGDEEPAEGYPEERQAGHQGHLPQLWHQGLSHRRLISRVGASQIRISSGDGRPGVFAEPLGLRSSPELRRGG